MASKNKDHYRKKNNIAHKQYTAQKTTEKPFTSDVQKPVKKVYKSAPRDCPKLENNRRLDINKPKYPVQSMSSEFDSSLKINRIKTLAEAQAHAASIKQNPIELNTTNSKIIKVDIYDAKIFGINEYIFDADAIKIIYALQNKGYETYVVGGFIRDQILGKKSTDIDIVTEAKPDVISKLFGYANSQKIGKRFPIVHLYAPETDPEIQQKRKMFECITFRAGAESNDYGVFKQDIFRRDININCLYYDPMTNEIFDFFYGVAGLLNQELEVITEPNLSFTEDPVRMLRVIRFAITSNCNIAPKYVTAINDNKHLIPNIGTDRLLNELNKIINNKNAFAILMECQKYDVLKYLIPFLPEQMKKRYQIITTMLQNVLDYKQRSIKKGKSIKYEMSILPYLYFYEYKERFDHYHAANPKKSIEEAHEIVSERILESRKNIGIVLAPRKSEHLRIFSIYFYMHVIENKIKKHIKPQLFRSALFRYSYHFFLMRAELENDPKLIATKNWWEKYREENEELINIY